MLIVKMLNVLAIALLSQGGLCYVEIFGTILLCNLWLLQQITIGRGGLKVTPVK